MANEITRSNVEGLIPVEYTTEIFNDVAKTSKALELFRRLPDMQRNERILPVLDSLPVAYFQQSDTAHKNVSAVSWKGVNLQAGEVAVIIPIAEAVLDDASVDIWANIKPAIVSEFARVIDSAIFFGVGKPSFWRDGLVPSVVASGNVITENANDTFYTTINKAMEKVEEDGFNVTAIAGGVNTKSKFRNMVDKNGQPLNTTEIGSLTRAFIDNGAWDKTTATAVVGDFNQAVYAIRQDLTYKVLDQATIVDPSSKEILFNLAQQDMVALRVTMRLAWAIPNPATPANGDEDTRFPFAVIKPQA